MHLDEITIGHQGPGLVTVSAEGRNKGGQRDHPGIHKQLGHLADATDVLLPVGIGEAQVLAEAMADVVTIEHIGGQAAFKQHSVDGVGQGAFARAGQAGEPKNGAAVTPLAAAGFPVHRRFMPDDVGGSGHDLIPSVGGHCHPPACLGRKPCCSRVCSTVVT